MAKGTPKTLTQAIDNGLIEACLLSAEMKSYLLQLSGDALIEFAAKTKQMQLLTIENHVLDFMRQKFGAAFLETDLWFMDYTEKEPAGILRDLAESIGVVKKAT